jgi:hypothetical protein
MPRRQSGGGADARVIACLCWVDRTPNVEPEILRRLAHSAEVRQEKSGGTVRERRATRSSCPLPSTNTRQNAEDNFDWACQCWRDVTASRQSNFDAQHRVKRIDNGFTRDVREAPGLP